MTEFDLPLVGLDLDLQAVDDHHLVENRDQDFYLDHPVVDDHLLVEERHQDLLQVVNALAKMMLHHQCAYSTLHKSSQLPI